MRRLNRLTFRRIVAGILPLLILLVWILVVTISHHVSVLGILALVGMWAIVGAVGIFIGVRLSEKIFDK